MIRRGGEVDGFRLDIPRLVLEPGRVHVLEGPSGAGKSTLLETLALLAPMTALDSFVLRLCPPYGEVRLDTPLAEAALDRFAHLRAGPVAFVAQSGGLLTFLAASAFARASARIAGTPVDEARLARIVTALDLGAEMDKGRATLSGGQRKRVALLRGLAARRDLLLVDEPSSGLDDRRAEAAISLLVEIAARESTAVLAAMHDVHRTEVLALPRLRIAMLGYGHAQLELVREMAA